MRKEIIDGINYRLNEDNLTTEVIEKRKGIFNDYEGDIVIPETVKFNEATYRVTSIGEYAFSRCNSLKSVTIPNSVTSIGDWAFNDCSSLTTIAIPDYVTSIGECAFSGCNSLISPVVCGEEIIGGVKYLLYSNRTAEVIKNEDYYEGDIVIPETVVFEKVPYRVTTIGRSAFECCENLTSITIPDSVTIIRDSAFLYCFSLTYIIIPNSVKSIGEKTFCYCKSLTSITIPDSVTEIGPEVFRDCKKLTSIIIPDNVKSIGYLAFSCCFSLASVVIPDGVRSIGYWAFEGCTPLKSITIPESVEGIGDGAFIGCTSLECVTFLSRTKIIEEEHPWLGKKVFLTNPSLKTINVPSDCVDYYKELLPEKLHDKIVELAPEK